MSIILDENGGEAKHCPIGQIDLFNKKKKKQRGTTR